MPWPVLDRSPWRGLVVALVAFVVLGRLVTSRASGRERTSQPNGFDHATITEDWDTPANIEQREMSYVRHELVRRRVRKGRLLDVGCGTAYGLAFTSPEADVAVGVDVNWENLRSARRHLPNGMFVQAKADALPFRDGSFDVVSCLEAAYYFGDQATSVRNMRRVMRPDGRLLMTMPNPLRPGFNPSAGAHSYLSAKALSETLRTGGFEPEIFGAFRWDEQNPLGRALELVRVLIVKTKVMPGSLAARAAMKRLAFRNMRSVAQFDRAVDLSAMLEPMVPPDFQGSCKILLAEAKVAAL